MKNYSLTKAARSDLKEITIYTEKSFGKKQRYKYSKILDDAFDKIAENPKIGRLREELSANYLCYQCEKHFIFYRIKGERIEIIRILNMNIDVKRYLYN